MNKLTPQQINQILAYRREGYSIRDIASTTGIKKYLIEQSLNQQRVPPIQSVQALPMASTPPLTMPAAPVPSTEMMEKERQLAAMQTQIEADRTALFARAQTLAEQERQLALKSNLMSVATQEHSEKLTLLVQQQQSLVNERRDLESRENSLQQLIRSMPDEQAQYEVFQKRFRKEKLMDRYNGLVQELIDDSSDCTWSGEQVDDYLEKIESLKDKIVAFCQENGIDPTGLLIYQGLVFLSNDVEQESAKQTSGFFSGTSVNFDYGPEYQTKIQSLLIENFDKPAPEELNESNDSTDNEDS